MKQIDTHWILTIFALLVWSSHILGSDTGILLSTVIYEVAAIVMGISLLVVIQFNSNETAMLNLLKVVINSPAARKATEEKMSKRTFLTVLTAPILFHIGCGIFFFGLGDKYLIMAFLLMMFYFRLSDLILTSSTVRYLNHLDELDEFIKFTEDE